jgi:hypothetical protein
MASPGIAERQVHFHARRTINMAQSPRLNAPPHSIGIAAGKDTPPVGEIDGHHSLRRLHKITQNAGRRHVIGESDGHKLRAFLLRHAEQAAP